MRLDWLTAHAFNDLLARHDGWEDPITLYEHYGEVVFVLVVLVAIVAGGRALRRGGVAALAATAVGLAVAQGLSRLVDRPRPFVTHEQVHLFAAHVADPGFPSDHATGAFAIAAGVWTHDRRWGAALLGLATVLALGRVGIGVHYPTDVLAGAVLGAGAAAAVATGPARRGLIRLADGLPRVPALAPRSR